MITSRILMIAIPNEVWNTKTKFGDFSIDIGEFVQDALSIERRLAKGVNLENERNRYTLCCARLEAALLIPNLHPVTDETAFRNALVNKCLPFIMLDATYLEELEMLLQIVTPDEKLARLEASFHTPDAVMDHARGFFNAAKRCDLQNRPNIQLRLNFLHWAVNAKCGVVEVVETCSWLKATVQNISLEGVFPTNSSRENPLDLGEGEDLSEDEWVDNTGRSAYLILRDQVVHALDCERKGQPAEVNFSNQPHEVITEVLREFISAGRAFPTEPAYIQVVYTDGSRGRDFPLICLPNLENDNSDLFHHTKPLKVALLSMRHLELDRDVDMAWFRNREVSKARAFGETDEFCYQQTLRQFREARSDEPLLIHMYQTGLQPAVIGFYRALIEELLLREKKGSPLRVVPFFFRKSGRYVQGKPWG